MRPSDLGKQSVPQKIFVFGTPRNISVVPLQRTLPAAEVSLVVVTAEQDTYACVLWRRGLVWYDLSFNGGR